MACQQHVCQVTPSRRCTRFLVNLPLMSTADAGVPSLPAMAKDLIEVEVRSTSDSSVEVATTTGTSGAPVEKVCALFPTFR
jgi:hypothetical protein